jgi:hypothetical protein
MTKLENTLDNILIKLDKIIILLEKSQLESKNSLNFQTNALEMLNAIGEEIPLPSPWNNPSTPTCNNTKLRSIESDILYKSPEKPNWYDIKDTSQ